ncbi:MAG: hypothetical protein LBE50_06525 [Gallionellaceae bacterium]|jgi:hypothetical protein|nr:hypothetical protein [Gallionellaceae bacterium]
MSNKNRLELYFTAILPELRRVAEPVAGRSTPYTLFFSISDGESRARVVTARGATLDEAWQRGVAAIRESVQRRSLDVRWLRIDHVDAIEEMNWAELNKRLTSTKRNYFRFGISLDAAFGNAFLETELNGNAMLYKGGEIAHCVVNDNNFLRYAKARHGITALDFADDKAVWMFSARGLFVGEDLAVHRLAGPGLDMGARASMDKIAPPDDAGRRIIEKLTLGDVEHLIHSSSAYLATQVNDEGKFRYGWFPCFNREIDTYNTLRHASSVYAMLEGWEVTRDEATKTGIDRSLAYLANTLIKRVELPSGERAAFLVDINGEIKLGGNAVSVLAFVKYTQITGDEQYLPLLDELAAGILHMRNPETGMLIHVLNYPALDVKAEFRIIYYAGEAAFSLMRLYELANNERWIDAVERMFGIFIKEDYWKAHDHWLSYATNALTRYRPKPEFFEFGIRNFAGYLNFVIQRITTFPTLLELMMAAEQMVTRLKTEHPELLQTVDVEKFYYALEKRAHYLLNGFFWPELAMFYAKPSAIVGSFFIRHHAFRVRIDDVEHYLSGYVAYRKYLLANAGNVPT